MSQTLAYKLQGTGPLFLHNRLTIRYNEIYTIISALKVKNKTKSKLDEALRRADHYPHIAQYGKYECMALAKG